MGWAFPPSGRARGLGHYEDALQQGDERGPHALRAGRRPRPEGLIHLPRGHHLTELRVQDRVGREAPFHACATCI